MVKEKYACIPVGNPAPATLVVIVKSSPLFSERVAEPIPELPETLWLKPEGVEVPAKFVYAEKTSAPLS